MRFHVVEFSQSSGGGLGIVLEDWLTPRKKETLWPPYKLASQYNKALTSTESPGDDWKVYPIKKMYYSTDDLLKARGKLKDAETESEVGTATEAEPAVNKRKRKRKPVKKLIESSSSENENVEDDVISLRNLPALPPDDTDVQLEINENSELFNNHNQTDDNLSERSGVPFSQLLHGSDTPNTSRSVRLLANAPATTPHQCTGSEVIARHLARIDKRLDHLEQCMKNISEKLCPSESTSFANLPEDVKLPCNSIEEIDYLENWLLVEDNVKILVLNLTRIGGKKVAHIVRRILERLFTNEVAVLYNWTGKNKKQALKILNVIKLIPGIVRKNGSTVNATDDEINTVITNWFRFTKDRNGGRDARRSVITNKETE